MANVMTPVDVYAVINAAAKEMFGADATIQACDTSSFVTVGEKMLRSGYENTLNALGLQWAKTIFAVRPYRGKFKLINTDSENYGFFSRKISYFYDDNVASLNFNTVELSPLTDGQTVDMYKIHKRYPLQMNFGGMKILTKAYTRFRNQLQVAFQSEAEFSRFYIGMGQEILNELEMNIEAENRLMVLNMIGATYNVGKDAQKRNLTAEFNAKFGTQYSSSQLRSEHLKEFLAFFVAEIKKQSDYMTDNNELYHLTPVQNNDAGEALHLLRHTPKDLQRLMLFQPLFTDAEALVLPEIFNDRYLKLENYEGVNYWQNVNDRSAVKVTPNQLNVTTGASATGTAVDLDYVVGIMFDRDAMYTATKIQTVDTTPLNISGQYYNTEYHWAKDYRLDQTENVVIFYMAD